VQGKTSVLCYRNSNCERKLVLKILYNTKLETHTHTHTHTRTVELLYTSDQLVTQTGTYKTHYKHNRPISMPSAGLESTITEINQLQPTPSTV